MENKNVGWLIIGIGILMTIIVIVFNVGLKNIISETCTHGPECSMYDSVAIQTWISLSIILIIIAIGIIIMLSKPKEKIIEKEKVIVKKVKEKKKPLNLKGLEKDELKVIELLKKEGNAMFQADLMERMEMGKVKTTRLLDKLEAKQLIERKRRGMNNIVVIKEM